MGRQMKTRSGPAAKGFRRGLKPRKGNKGLGRTTKRAQYTKTK